MTILSCFRDRLLVATWHHGCLIQRQSWLVFCGIPHTYIERCGNEQDLKPGVTLDAQGMVSGKSWDKLPPARSENFDGGQAALSVKRYWIPKPLFQPLTFQKTSFESFGNGHGGYGSLRKKIWWLAASFDSLFQYSRAQGYPMITEYQMDSWLRGGCRRYFPWLSGCRLNLQHQALRRGWKTSYTQSVD